MSAPRFSVVIPTNERRELVTRGVKSLAAQRDADFEVIVVVDGSTDGTAQALAGLRVPFPLTVLEQDNQGAAAARNAGVNRATGELILFLDDDMEADPALLLEHARSHEAGADLVLGHIPLHPATPASALALAIGRWAAARAERLGADPGSVSERDLLTGQLSIRHAVFDALGGFDAGLTGGGRFGGEDVDLGCRALDAGLRVVFNPAAVSHQQLAVDPAVFMRRAFQSGQAQHVLTGRHPERAERLASGMRLGARRDRALFAVWLVAPATARTALIDGAAWVARRSRRSELVIALMLAIRRLEFRRGVLAAQWRARRARLVVLAYHSVADLEGDPVLAPYGVALPRLERQLDDLRRCGWRFVDVDAVKRVVAAQGNVPRRAILLTFDDGYADLLDALPALRKRSIPAVVFIVAGLIGQSNLWDQPLGAGRLELLAGEQLGALAAAGVEIGSHGLAHRRLDRLGAAELREELVDSAQRLAVHSSAPPRTMSYPYGAWSVTAAAAVRSAGYELAFTIRPGVVRAHSDRVALPRVEVLAADSTRRLSIKVATAGWPRRWREPLLRLLDSGLVG